MKIDLIGNWKKFSEEKPPKGVVCRFMVPEGSFVEAYYENEDEIMDLNGGYSITPSNYENQIYWILESELKVTVQNDL